MSSFPLRRAPAARGAPPADPAPPARTALLLAALATAGCADSGTLGDGGSLPDASRPDAGTADARLDARDTDAAEPGADAAPRSCACTAGAQNDLVHILSADAELWTYDPIENQFAQVTPTVCGTDSPFSMAVDSRGMAWTLFVDTREIYTQDVNDPARCEDPGYIPGSGGFGLFGMTFTANGADDPCSKLYALSYSGSGPFREGPGLGRLGVMDPAVETTFRELATIDFDGGELAGTGDGRLFAFAGVDPAKLVEYDKETGAPLEVVPLEGLSKTNASAFAFFAGDFYFFTEAPPPECDPCLETHCAAAYADCQEDPACAEDLACAMEEAQIRDECGGSLPAELQECVGSTCAEECLPPPRSRISQVTRLDFDESEGSGRALTVVHPGGPIRVVGADASTCVPVVPF